MKQIKTILLAQLAIISILLCISAPAWANLAANTQIINSASLHYNDGSGMKTATANVTVTVSLVPTAPPTITALGPYTTSYAGPATTLTDDFIITSGSNGPDTYNLSTTICAHDNTSGGYSAVPVIATVQLGATVTTVGSTKQIIKVPADGNLPVEMSGVNGIAIGDRVVISGELRTVTAIEDNSSGISTITLNSELSSAPGVGIIVGEQKTVQVTVTAGNIITSGTDVTVSDSLTATSNSGSGPANTSGCALNTYTSGVAELTKFVRNVSTPSGSGDSITYGINTYYKLNVTAKPGDILEYILVAHNTSSSGPVTAAYITDAVPTSYVQFKTNVYSGNTRDVTYVDDAGAASYLTGAVDTDTATYSAPNLTVYVGTGATSSSGGSIPATKSVYVLYQVTVNP
jgi:hypothetical protein